MTEKLVRGRGRSRKTLRETINKDLKINEFERTMLLDKMLCLLFIYVVDLIFAIFYIMILSIKLN